MYLLIDYREAAFINKLSEYDHIENDIPKSIEINNIKLDYKITSLPVGDFIIQKELHDNNTIEMTIERKSIKDLCASITDGRFREQKQRLLNSIGDCSKITYMIEGMKHMQIQDDKQLNMLSQVIVDGSILNLIFKHNYKVVQTENKLDTFNNIVLLYKKFRNDDLKNDTDIVHNIRLIKRSEAMANHKLVHQLCLVSGVSSKIASVIISNLKIESIKDLIQRYLSKLSEEEMELMLSEIVISENSGKVRKVGKAMSKKIYIYFCKNV